MQQAVIKCPKCGLNSFSDVTHCRRCSTELPPIAPLTIANIRRPIQETGSFQENPAPDGLHSVGVLKVVGILCLIGSIVICLAIIAQLLDSKSTAYSGPATILVFSVFLTGLTACALFFVVAVICENLVAIRKNTAHLAGIHSNTIKEPQRENAL